MQPYYNISFSCFRSTHELVEMNGILVAVGGNDGNSSHNSVEMYDPDTDRWTPLAPLCSRRSSVGAAVINCFNMELKQIQKSDEMKLSQKYDSTAWLSRSRASPLKK